MGDFKIFGSPEEIRKVIAEGRVTSKCYLLASCAEYENLCYDEATSCYKSVEGNPEGKYSIDAGSGPVVIPRSFCHASKTP